MSTFQYISDRCECGNLKKKTASKCAVCASAKAGTRWVNTCPTCGSPKTKRALQCKACATNARNRQYVATRPWYGIEPRFDVPEDFARAFAGFFMGEGNVYIMRHPYSLRLAIGLHRDDAEVIGLIEHYFGGSIHHHGQKRLVTWYKCGNLGCLAVLRIIKAYAEPLHAIKERDVDLAIDYVYWRLAQPHHLTSDLKAEAENWKQRMRETKIRTKGQAISA